MESISSPAETSETFPKLLTWSFDRREELEAALQALSRLPLSGGDWALCIHDVAQRRTIFSGGGRDSVGNILRQLEDSDIQTASSASPESARGREQYRLTVQIENALLAVRARQSVHGGAPSPTM